MKLKLILFQKVFLKWTDQLHVYLVLEIMELILMDM